MIEPPSQTQIVNMAASMVGSTQRIRSLSDSGSLASHAREFWPSIIGDAMAFPWTFTVSRAYLNASSDAPLFGYTHAYALPVDCLRWLPPSHEDGEIFYDAVQEDGMLLSNCAPPLPIRYVSSLKADQVAIWPRYFAKAIEAELAAYLAEPLTQSAKAAASMRDLADALWRKAKRTDALARGQKTRIGAVLNSRWATAGQRRARV